MTTRADIVRSFWAAVQARKWDYVEGLLDACFRAELPQSGESFDREHYILMNRYYPGDWAVRLRDIHECEQCIVTEVEVDIDTRIDRAISFFRVQEGKIVNLREFWIDPFPIPEWRVTLFESGGVPR